MIITNNQFTKRENKAKVNQIFIGELKNGFERALIWQDESLDDYQDRSLTYAAQEKVDQTVMIFLSMVFSDDMATRQMIDHGAGDTGHDLALQMLGHGAGFWEQKETNFLDDILNFLLDNKAIKPFTFYYDESQKELNWDSI